MPAGEASMRKIAAATAHLSLNFRGLLARQMDAAAAQADADD
jgi:hypothetical protein